MKQNPLTVIVGTVLLVIFVLLLFVFQVRQSEVAVVTTFGKPVRDITEPGAYWKAPWPIQKVHKFDQRIHNLEGKFEQVQTADQFSLLIMVYVGWNISDAKVFSQRFGDSTAKAEESLEGLLRNAYSGVVGRHAFPDFVSTDEKQLKLAEIEQEMLQRVQADSRAITNGLDVKFLGIKKIGLPESVTELVFQRMKSEREVKVSEIQFEGERQARDLRSAADAESARLISDADAQATRIRGLGDSEAAKSFEVFKQDPELARFILELGALEAFTKERTTLILDTQTSPLGLLRGPTVAPARNPKP